MKSKIKLFHAQCGPQACSTYGNFSQLKTLGSRPALVNQNLHYTMNPLKPKAGSNGWAYIIPVTWEDEAWELLQGQGLTGIYSEFKASLGNLLSLDKKKDDEG